jgi:hypothetical protein
MEMKVIVIRQPWAWLIVNGFKDIENRSWRTKYRGTLLIQASANLPPKRKLEADLEFARQRGVKNLPEEFETGGIIGIAELKDCVDGSRSRWFHGPIGWVLANQRALPFIRLKGRLGLFDPPRRIRERVLEQLGR